MYKASTDGIKTKPYSGQYPEGQATETDKQPMVDRQFDKIENELT